MKKVYICNTFWGKSRESQGLRWRLCSLAFKESLYWLYFLRKITRISGPQREAVHWYLKKACIGYTFWGKSREYPCLRGKLCILTYEESLYL
jgi:hypothetical protein